MTVLASTALLGGSACKVDGDGFAISSARIDEATLTLTFSQPLADLEGVDPNDFRISFAQTVSVTYTYEGVTETYEYTNYIDLVNFVGYETGYYGYRLNFLSLVPGSAANQLVLEAGTSIAPACDAVADTRQFFEMYAAMYYDDARFDVTMFLHYAGGEIPIESTSGSVLADIGPDWVLSEESYVGREGFGFTNLSPQLRIPCP